MKITLILPPSALAWPSTPQCLSFIFLIIWASCSGSLCARAVSIFVCRFCLPWRSCHFDHSLDAMAFGFCWEPIKVEREERYPRNRARIKSFYACVSLHPTCSEYIKLVFTVVEHRMRHCTVDRSLAPQGTFLFLASPYVAQAGLKLGFLTASWVLGLQVCATMPIFSWPFFCFLLF
jgi:hypothetical protein